MIKDGRLREEGGGAKVFLLQILFTTRQLIYRSFA